MGRPAPRPLLSVNILYLCHRIPFPPDKGDKIRSYHQIDYLARRHRLHVVTFVDSAEDERHVPALRERCASLAVAKRGKVGTVAGALLALLTGEPFSVRCFRSGSLRGAVDRLMRKERFDVILVFSSAMAQYAAEWKDLRRLVDFVDVDSEKWRAYADLTRGPMAKVYRLEANRLGRYDLAIASEFDRSIFVSQAEADLFRRLGAEGPIDVIPMGVDLEYFRPAARPPREGSAPEIVFVGMMSYFPNIDAVSYFAREIFPLIRKDIPEARFTIVGRSPSARVRVLAGAGVRVTGAVDDVRPFLAAASVAVAPFRVSRGMQSKVLEAMASGLPIVGSSLAFQGIPAREGDGVEAADAPEGFAEAVVRLLRDPALRGLRGESARRYVERHHRWEDRGATLEALLLDAGNPRKEANSV